MIGLRWDAWVCVTWGPDLWARVAAGGVQTTGKGQWMISLEKRSGLGIQRLENEKHSARSSRKVGPWGHRQSQEPAGKRCPHPEREQAFGYSVFPFF